MSGTAHMLLWLMALGTAALNILLVAGILALFNAAWRQKMFALIRAHARLAIFVLSLVSVIGTLWMQYGANLAPCLFCWWQRICMYPIALISGIAIFKNAELYEIADYILGLSAIGAAIGLYQHLLQMLPQGSLIPCSAADECAVRSVFEFNYITLPWMAFSMFAVFIFIALVGRKRITRLR